MPPFALTHLRARLDVERAVLEECVERRQRERLWHHADQVGDQQVARLVQRDAARVLGVQPAPRGVDDERLAAAAVGDLVGDERERGGRKRADDAADCIVGAGRERERAEAGDERGL